MEFKKNIERQWLFGCTALYAALVSGSASADGASATVDQALGGIGTEVDNFRLSPGWAALFGLGTVMFAAISLIARDKRWLVGSMCCVLGAAIWYGGGDIVMRWIPKTGTRIAQQQ